MELLKVGIVFYFYFGRQAIEEDVFAALLLFLNDWFWLLLGGFFAQIIELMK